MDAGVRQKRVEALEKIKENALERAKEGADSFEVRDFVTEARKSWLISYQTKKHLKKQCESRKLIRVQKKVKT
jgi:hypothetical protein